MARDLTTLSNEELLKYKEELEKDIIRYDVLQKTVKVCL